MLGHHLPLAAYLGKRRRLGLARAAVLMATAVACAGCMASAKREYIGSIPTDYRLRHPITVQESNRTLDVFVGARRGALTEMQRSEVRAFAQAWRREATGGIMLGVPSGTANARAAAEMAREIRSVFAQAGAPAHAVVTRNYRPPDPAMLATIRLTYPKMTAQAGPCGLWPADLGPTVDTEYNQNRQFWNLGCSNQRNLAAMVENPADLVQPRAETPIYAGRRATVLDKFRKGESTATVNPGADKGKISDVGK